MDLILFQPGDAGVLSAGAGSLIQGDWPITKGASPLSTSNKNPFFELTSIHHGMKQQITTDVSNQARTSGRPVITEFTCVKYVDAASVKLYDYCLRAAPLGKGASAPSIIYLLRNSGETLANIITIQLRDAIISEIQFQSHPDDMPTEQFKLNFTEILWTYSMQANDVTVPGQIASGWSVRQNRAIGAFTSP
ncbi:MULTISPECIES: Hcp family type VI secretion system effector [Undibacterium]|jgi:type VI secretion system secreted protein Hcp|uniref:Hcp family type VI secretion system effector n=1 Tax=Undibacterium TaxID=401469 RepID=UPI001389D2E5|nr:type VI secretion system tube protein Hcp [Undibacterium crateris]NDI84164.1 Hcp1 family type VI secretion system effector [Undibacterium crateris]